VGKTDSLLLGVHLGKSKQLSVEVRVFGKGFSSGKSTYNLQRGGDTAVMIYFQPDQNLAYNGEIFLLVEKQWLLRANVKGNGRLNNSYYASTFNLWDSDLKSELKSITSKGQTSLGYNGARDEMYGDLDNYGGKVTCAYTGRTATFNSRSGANNNSFNCEHTWPQSQFCSSNSSTMKADIHHLFATDVNANSRRGSYPFGVVSGNATWQEGGSKQGGGVFEPRDEQKGATARAMLYMITRYGNCSGFIGSAKEEDVLRTWANDYAPSTKEVDRNDGIHSLQKNRNPFVDVPAFVERIHSFRTNTPRNLQAVVMAADTLIDPAPGFDDSTIYYAYLVNTGDEDFNVAGISAGAAKYTYSSGQVAPGDALRIRFAIAGTPSSSINVQIGFDESYLSSIALTLNFTISSPFIMAEDLFSIEGNKITMNHSNGEDALLQVYTLNGQLLAEERISTFHMMDADLPKGLLILHLSTTQRRSAKLIMR